MGRTNKSLILFILILVFNEKYSQAQTNRDYYDIVTYKHYTLANWDSVIRLSNEAIKEKFDFYYLRQRIGWSYIFKYKHKMAVNHFKKAMEFEPYSQDAVKSLYTAYLYANQTGSARFLIPKMQSANGNENPLPEPNTVDAMYAEIGNKKPNDRRLQGDFLSATISLSHTINHRFFITHQYTYINQEAANKQQNLTQNQYYLSAAYYINPDWYIMPAVHVLNAKVQRYQSTSLALYGETGFNYQLLKTGAFIGYLKSEDDYQRQIGAYFVFYPLGNAYLYIKNTFTLHYDSQSINKRQKVWNPLIGFKVISKYWIEAEYTGGKRTNYMDKSASIIYNSYEELRNRFAVINYFLLTRNFSIIVTLSDEEKYTTQTYHHKGITGGLRWTFTNLPLVY